MQAATFLQKRVDLKNFSNERAGNRLQETVSVTVFQRSDDIIRHVAPSQQSLVMR